METDEGTGQVGGVPAKKTHRRRQQHVRIQLMEGKWTMEFSNLRVRFQLGSKNATGLVGFGHKAGWVPKMPQGWLGS
uniref:Uncharacterized protein n=1 Tax=Globodera rostochiensis TaxID=31243 RepID=A0A914H067_GLORO